MAHWDQYDASLDNPVELFEYDAFNRRPFSERLAATIASLPCKDGSPVLGLYGKWGYGKSTVLNFVKLALKRQAADKFEIFAFNPWFFREQAALLDEFFAGLANAFDAAIGRSGEKIGAIMARYSGAFIAIPVVGGAIEKLLEKGGEDLAADTIGARRDRLVDAMRKADRKVVVLIDDLDRLDRDEVLTMLKLVRLSANFPNVIYLLAFDESRVARLAGTAYGAATDDGRQFLEKIVQYPFTLPAVGAARLTLYIVAQVKVACDAAAIDLDEKVWSNFRALCRDALLTALTTPRQAVRYANALRFALPLLKGEVDPYDQMIVEAARILSPEFYAFLRDYPDPTKIVPGMDMGQCPSGPLEQGLLAAFFRFDPPSSKPINDPRYHDRYFSYAVASDDLADSERELLLELADKGRDHELTERLTALFATKFDSLIERLTSAVDAMDLVVADRLALALAPLGSLVPGIGPICDRPEAQELADLVAQLAVHYLPLRTSRSAQIADEVLGASSPVSFARLVWYALDRAAQNEDNEGGALDWDGLRAALLTRVSDAVRSQSLSEGGRDTLRLLQFWQSSNPEALRAHIAERLVSDPRQAFDLLALFGDPLVNYQNISEMSDPARIVQLTAPWIGGDPADGTISAELIDLARRFQREHDQRLAAEECKL